VDRANYWWGVSETAQLKNLGKVLYLYQARCKWTNQIRTREAMRT